MSKTMELLKSACTIGLARLAAGRAICTESAASTAPRRKLRLTRRIRQAGFLSMLLCCTVGRAVTISSTFDTDAEGWIGTPGEGQVDYFGAGGNPGGHIRVTDIGVGGGLASGAIAPGKFLGDLSVFNGGAISYDMATFAGGGGTFAIFGTVRITGGGLIAMFDTAGAAPPLGAWLPFIAPLTAAGWGVSDADWLTILGNVTEIAFSTDAFNGGDTIGVDNFTLSSADAAIPEPGSLVLLGGGLAALAFVRRKRFR